MSKKELQNEAIEALKKMLKPGDTVYHTIKSVARSGMSREISFFIVRDGQIRCIDWEVSNALGLRQNDRNGAVRVSGSGMDMGFATVYSIGRKLFPDGFKLPEGKMGRNGDTSGYDKDGGYALKSEWI